MSHRLGLHWIRVHPDNHDYAHIEAMQYPSVKLFEWQWSNRDACRDLLTVLPQNAYILARDHPMSEQKGDMFANPEGTGTRHANEWAIKVATGNVHTPHDRTFFLGINEPDATTGDRAAIDRYTTAFLDRLRVHGLRGGAFNFSTGHPRTVDGTGATQADYTVFEQSHQAIVRGHHIAVLHIYGTTHVPCVPGHYDRLKACPWTDVQWVVGECGIDEHVIGGGNHDGYLRTLGASDAYCRWLDDFILGIGDSRIHSYQVFSYDFSHPWDSFDIRPIRPHLEAYPWQHVKLAAAPTGPTATMYVTAPSGLNLRASPEGDVLIAIPFAAPVTITGVPSVNGWLRGTYAGHSGWLSSAYVSPDKPQQHTTHLPNIVSEPPEPTPPAPDPTTDNWARCIAFVRRWEGGWADHPSDPGGATMKGITLVTYTRWRVSRGLPTPTKDDLRNISDAEANQIYFEWYWQASGSDKLPWPLCLANFDTAVNAGPERAAEMLQKSGGNFLTYMGHLMTWYASIPNFEVFGRAWIKRRAEILLEGAK